jgi:hypothetical protein
MNPCNRRSGRSATVRLNNDADAFQVTVAPLCFETLLFPLSHSQFIHLLARPRNAFVLPACHRITADRTGRTCQSFCYRDAIVVLVLVGPPSRNQAAQTS